ncbi:MAG TPA: aminotransferase class V-fold PLP-dependent enzyme [Mycobacteriales bacterium]|nr:aminotransferase class V-fold PLP-dependent enzyme [Mycobacteriales bacterium]
MALPARGMPAAEILDALQAKRSRDARWQDGRTFGLVFDGGPEVHAVAEAVAAMFLHDNALNTAAFPSLGEIQAEVVDICAELFHAPPGAAGFMTSGGTESILMAVKAARERGRAERGITDPHMVVPASGHAAFHKGAHYFGLRVTTVPVAADWRADVDAMAAAITDDTVLVVGSAPQYPQGVIDPIPELAALAADVGASFHTDACMGGFVLPFMERLGMPVPSWDFRVPGVTTISADLHKLGYAPKGASVVLHRTKELRRYQTFVFDGWLGGLYASPAMQGTRPAMPMACAWAVLHHLGEEGYLRLTRTTIDAATRIRTAVEGIGGIAVLGEPDAHMHAITAAPGSTVDVFAVGDALGRRGWYHDKQAPPPSLHATVSAGNAPVVDEYVADLAACVAEGGTASTTTGYSTLE